MRALLAAALLALLTATAVALVVSGTARALPPGGAGSDTPGTSSTVSSEVGIGERIQFTVWGFPAREIISVKIDDGITCGASAPQGACVVHSQKIPGSGPVSGSFVVGADVPPEIGRAHV